MRKSIVKQKLGRREPAIGVALHFTDPSIYEMTSLMGFDFLWMDLEHHAYSVQTADNLMRAARVGTSDLMARPAKGEFMRIGRLLEAGAQGILYPRCDNADEARQVVRWSKFAPLGTRGFDSANPDNPYCTMDGLEYLRAANEETWIAIQIEDPKALEHADEIAAIDGVDVLMLGPADYSILSGFPLQFRHPKIEEALGVLKRAADRHGKSWGTTADSMQRIQELVDRGARWTCCGCDLIWVKNGLEQAKRDLAGLRLAAKS